MSGGTIDSLEVLRTPLPHTGIMRPRCERSTNTGGVAAPFRVLSILCLLIVREPS